MRKEITCRLWLSVIKNDIQKFEETLKALSGLHAVDIDITNFFFRLYGHETTLMDLIFVLKRDNFVYSIIKILGNKIVIQPYFIVEKIEEKENDLVLYFLENQLLATMDIFINNVSELRPLLQFVESIPLFIENLPLDIFKNRIYAPREIPSSIDYFFRTLISKKLYASEVEEDLKNYHSLFIIAYLKQLINIKKYFEIPYLFFLNVDLLKTEHLHELFPPIIEAAKSPLVEISFRQLEEVAKAIQSRGGDIDVCQLGYLYLTISETTIGQEVLQPVAENYFITAEQYWKVHNNLATADVYIRLASMKQSLLHIKFEHGLIEIEAPENIKNIYFKYCILKSIEPYYIAAANLNDDRAKDNLKRSRTELKNLETTLAGKGIEVDTTDISNISNSLLDSVLDNLLSPDNLSSKDGNNNNTSSIPTSRYISTTHIGSPIHHTASHDEKGSTEEYDVQGGRSKRQKSTPSSESISDSVSPHGEPSQFHKM